MSRSWAYLMSALVLASMTWPATWPLGRDSFPLSSYPMFSQPRPRPLVTIQYAVGLQADGQRRLLEPSLIANGEVLQARAVLSRAVGQGADATLLLCAEIAARVAGRGGLREVVSVRIVTGTHDAIHYLTGVDTVGQERVHGECAVARREVAP